ncbi:MAG: LPXTG cell wall anchor domain-containing protein, partial [Flavobacteriales bacterium]
VDYTSNIKFDDTAVLSSNPYTFCEIEPVKAFEKAYALLLPKMKQYVKSDDTLVLKGRDGSAIQLVRFGQLKKRLQHTWYSSKDTNSMIEIRGDKWIFRTRGMPVVPSNVYTFEAIDDKWMDGNWNRVIDYAKLTNSNRTIEYYFIHCGAQSMTMSVTDEDEYSTWHNLDDPPSNESPDLLTVLADAVEQPTIPTKEKKQSEEEENLNSDDAVVETEVSESGTEKIELMASEKNKPKGETDSNSIIILIMALVVVVFFWLFWRKQKKNKKTV